MWATYTMDVRVKYLDGNRYSQLLSNGTYLAEIYPMDKKDDTGQALKKFLWNLMSLRNWRSMYQKRKIV